MKIIHSPRIRLYSTRISIFLIAAAVITGTVGCAPPPRPPPTPIPISDWYDLDGVRNSLSDSYILMNDLDSTTAGYEELASPTASGGEGWQPSGTEDDWCTATFEGQGYEIRDLFIDHPGENYVGLIGIVDVEGVIENLGMVDAYVVGDMVTGGLVGASAGTVTNSYVTGSVAGNHSVGGLVGSNGGGGTVSYCYFNGSVTGFAHVGCLVGSNGDAVVSNSYSTGNANGAGSVGGLVGRNWDLDGTVSNSYSTSNVTGVKWVGGLVGENSGTLRYCYAMGNVTGDDGVGGLVGYSSFGSTTNCFWDTETSGQANSDGGTGRTTMEMQNLATFSGAGWSIIGVALNETNPASIWNIADNFTYPFLSWQS